MQAPALPRGHCPLHHARQSLHLGSFLQRCHQQSFVGQQIGGPPSYPRRGDRRSLAVTVDAISMPRNWQAFKMNAKYTLVNFQDSFWSLPFVATVVNKFNQLQSPITAKILALMTVVANFWQEVSLQYEEFLTAENMREWKWRRKHEQEWDMWRRIAYAAAGVFFTILWETIVPTSLFWALIPPLWLAWVLYDNWLLSPFTLGLLIMLPLKFPPYGAWKWL